MSASTFHVPCGLPKLNTAREDVDTFVLRACDEYLSREDANLLKLSGLLFHVADAGADKPSAAADSACAGTSNALPGNAKFGGGKLVPGVFLSVAPSELCAAPRPTPPTTCLGSRLFYARGPLAPAHAHALILLLVYLQVLAAALALLQFQFR